MAPAPRSSRSPIAASRDRVRRRAAAALPAGLATYDALAWAKGWARVVGIAAFIACFSPRLLVNTQSDETELVLPLLEAFKQSWVHGLHFLPAMAALALLAAPRIRTLRALRWLVLPAVASTYVLPALISVGISLTEADGYANELSLSDAWMVLFDSVLAPALALLAVGGHLVKRRGATARRRALIVGGALVVLLALHLPVHEGQSIFDGTLQMVGRQGHGFGPPEWALWLMAAQAVALTLGMIASIAVTALDRPQGYAVLQGSLRLTILVGLSTVVLAAVGQYVHGVELRGSAATHTETLSFGLHTLRQVAHTALSVLVPALALAVWIEDGLPSPKETYARAFD